MHSDEYRAKMSSRVCAYFRVELRSLAMRLHTVGNVWWEKRENQIRIWGITGRKDVGSNRYFVSTGMYDQTQPTARSNVIHSLILERPDRVSRLEGLKVYS